MSSSSKVVAATTAGFRVPTALWAIPVFNVVFWVLVSWPAVTRLAWKWAHETWARTRRAPLQDNTYLSEWLGHGRDRGDHQWDHYRKHLPLLASAACGFLVLSHALRFLLARAQIGEGTPSYRRWRARFYGLFGLGFLIFLHGVGGSLKILVIVAISYALVSSLRHRGFWAPVCLWAFHIAVLYSSEVYKGYRWSHVPLLKALGWGPWLDRRSGMLNWTLSWNMAMLRVISWGMDYWWKANSAGLPPPTEAEWKHACHQRSAADRLTIDPTPCSRVVQKSRARKARSQQEYSDFLLLVGYVGYAPLYITGPTMTFNSFASQVARPQRLVSWRGKAHYLVVKAVVNLLFFELFQHTVYSFAMIKQMQGNVSHGLVLAAIDGSLFLFFQWSVFTLLSIWMKFLVIWRLARAWAILDDMEAPENMRFCIIVSTSIARFWREWHASYNEWLLRYVYLPLGGSRGTRGKRFFAIAVVFGFVGFWHDRTMQLFAWAWISIVFMVLEVLVQAAVGRTSLTGLSRWLLERLGETLSITVLIVANLIGFSYNLGGSKDFWKLTQREGPVPLLLIAFVLFTCVVTRGLLDTRKRLRDPESGAVLPAEKTA